MRTLVIGGARSGKTAVAESLLRSRDDVVYVATGYVPDADDAEWQDRVGRHRSLRPGSWRTVETLDVVALLGEDGAPLLIDCLTLWLTRLMDRAGCWDDDGWLRGQLTLRGEVDALVVALRDTSRDVVLVTNEVGQGIVPASSSGRRFRDEMGRLNAVVAAECDEVLLCVAGRTLRLT